MELDRLIWRQFQAEGEAIQVQEPFAINLDALMRRTQDPAQPQNWEVYTRVEIGDDISFIKKFTPDGRVSVIKNKNGALTYSEYELELGKKFLGEGYLEVEQKQDNYRAFTTQVGMLEFAQDGSLNNTVGTQALAEEFRTWTESMQPLVEPAPIVVQPVQSQTVEPFTHNAPDAASTDGNSELTDEEFMQQMETRVSGAVSETINSSLAPITEGINEWRERQRETDRTLLALRADLDRERWERQFGEAERLAGVDPQSASTRVAVESLDDHSDWISGAPVEESLVERVVIDGRVLEEMKVDEENSPWGTPASSSATETNGVHSPNGNGKGSNGIGIHVENGSSNGKHALWETAQDGQWSEIASTSGRTQAPAPSGIVRSLAPAASIEQLSPPSVAVTERTGEWKPTGQAVESVEDLLATGGFTQGEPVAQDIDSQEQPEDKLENDFRVPMVLLETSEKDKSNGLKTFTKKNGQVGYIRIKDGKFVGEDGKTKSEREGVIVGVLPVEKTKIKIASSEKKENKENSQPSIEIEEFNSVRVLLPPIVKSQKSLITPSKVRKLLDNESLTVEQIQEKLRKMARGRFKRLGLVLSDEEIEEIKILVPHTLRK